MLDRLPAHGEPFSLRLAVEHRTSHHRVVGRDLRRSARPVWGHATASAILLFSRASPSEPYLVTLLATGVVIAGRSTSSRSTRVTDGVAGAGLIGFGGVLADTTLVAPARELNLRARFRKTLLYPLSYGAATCMLSGPDISMARGSREVSQTIRLGRSEIRGRDGGWMGSPANPSAATTTSSTPAADALRDRDFFLIPASTAAATIDELSVVVSSMYLACTPATRGGRNVHHLRRADRALMSLCDAH